MRRESMRGELTLATILYIKKRILKNKKAFTTKHYFLDKNGTPLPPNARSVPEVAQRNIAGAVIEALATLGIDENASNNSSDYFAVMHHLGESLLNEPMHGNAKPKIDGYNDSLPLLKSALQ